MKIARLEAACAALALVAIVTGTLASASGVAWPRKDHGGDLDSPLLALELLRAPADLLAVVGPPGSATRAGLARAVRFDFAFIAAYAPLFVLVGLVVRQRGFRTLGWLVVLGGLAAAGLDLAENRAMLALLETGAGAPRGPSLGKWVAIFAVLGGVALAFTRSGAPPLRRFIGHLAAAVDAAAALLGLCGVLAGADPLIESGARLMAGGLLLGFLFFVSHRPLQAGLVPALDWLARRPILKALADWPSEEVADDVRGPPPPGERPGD
jgi:hypothetical protein